MHRLTAANLKTRCLITRAPIMLCQSEKLAQHCTGILCIDDSFVFDISINVDNEKTGDVV